MIKKSVKFLGLSLMLMLSAGTVFAAETVYETTEQEVIGKGLTYEHKSKLTVDGWVDIHVLIADLTDENLSLDVIRDEDSFGLRGSLSDMADNDSEEIIGGINGSFFNMNVQQSDIEGFEYAQNRISFLKDDYNLASLRGADMIFYEGESPFIDFLSSDISFTTDKYASVYVVGVNSTADLNNPVIFNRNAYEDTAAIDALASVYKLVVVDDMITAIVSPGESVEIPEKGYILTFNESQANDILTYIHTGDAVTLDVQTNIDTDKLELAMPGGGRILKDGELVEEGLIVGKNTRNPRSAIGVTADGNTLIAMVVDGRRESIGATHEELAEYLKEYDIADAMHLDGGGSSTLIAREVGDFSSSVKNLPSDGQERHVVNGLGFVLSAPTTEEFNLIINVDQNRVFVDNKITLEVKAADLNFNPVAIDQDQIAWSISGGYGILHKMEFVPKEAGTTTLTASYQGVSQSIDIEVVDELIDIEIVPKVIHFEDGIQTFTVIGTDVDGYRSIINNDLLTWEISAPVGTVYQGIFRGGDTPTDARIDVSYKGIKEVAYVVTGEIRASAIDLSKVDFETLVYPETVTGSVQRKDDDGKSLISIGYDFVPSEVSQAVYAAFSNGDISREIDEIILGIDTFPEDVLIKGLITDNNGELYTVSFEEADDGDVLADIPDTVSYPIRLSKVYVVTLASEIQKTGELVIRNIDSVTKVKEKDLDDVISIPPVDSKYELFPGDAFSIRIFGATSGRNRLLDDVVLGKVYEEFNEADYAVYAGSSQIDESRITNDHFVYDDTFQTVDLDQVRLISLGMSAGSLIKTDSSQWQKLENSLASALQNTIVIIGTEKLIDNEDDSFTKEGELLHQIISDYAGKSGRHIFYINASGYDYNLSYYEGIRYIDLNGLWYKVGDDHEVDLYDSFQSVNLNISDDDVTYNVSNLFPKTTVTE